MPHCPEDAAPATRSAADLARFVALLTDTFEPRIRFDEVHGLPARSIAPPTPSLRFDMQPGLVGRPAAIADLVRARLRRCTGRFGRPGHAQAGSVDRRNKREQVAFLPGWTSIRPHDNCVCADIQHSRHTGCRPTCTTLARALRVPPAHHTPACAAPDGQAEPVRHPNETTSRPRVGCRKEAP